MINRNHNIIILFFLCVFLLGLFNPLKLGATVKIGSEFQVNTYFYESQHSSSVAGLSSGGFVVTWTSTTHVGDVSGGVYGQRYDSSGNTVGSEFRINTYTTDGQTEPSAAGLSDGGFVVTWTSDGQDGDVYGVYGQRYDSSGNTVGSEFRVNSYTTGEQRDSSVTGFSDGGFVVVWTSDGQDGDVYGVYGQRYDSSGNTVGSEFQVNTYTDWYQSRPSVACLADDGFVVTWDSYGQDGSYYGVFGQRYNSSGSMEGTEFQVNTYTSNSQYFSSVVGLSDGGFVVTWESEYQDTSSNGIYGQLFDGSGNKVGSEFQINTHTSLGQFRPSVVSFPDDYFVVTWDSQEQDGSGYGTYAQEFNSSGDKVGDEFLVNTHIAGDQDYPSIAVLGGGRFVVTWQSWNQDGQFNGIYGQRFIRELLGDELAIDFDGDGKTDILWRHTSDTVYAWLCDGISIKSHGVLGGSTTDWQIQGVGDIDGDGKSDIVWRHTSGTVYVWLCDGISIKSHGVLGGSTTDWQIQELGDLDGDGKSDIVWQHTSGTVYAWLCDGISIKSHGELGGAVTDWQIQEVGDLDGDGKSDIVWRHTSGTVYVWCCDGISIKSHGELGGAGTDWQIQELGDVDGDGCADIVWQHTSGTVYVWCCDGISIKSNGVLGKGGAGWQIREVGDIDGDGCADILWRHTSGTVYVWCCDGISIKSHGDLGGAGADWQMISS